MKYSLDRLTHRQRVCFLYKMILRTHKGLPPELRDLGDRYVKEEFRRHKNCDPSYVGPFMMEWTRYVANMNKQLRSAMKVEGEEGSKRAEFGNYLEESDLDGFSEHQLNQLLALANALRGVDTKDSPS